jgi:hypothetical protein
MNEKKDIDRLFREKFRDFEVAPPEMAWSNIEAELLKKKKKRRVIPLWYRVGGVAALLVIGLMISLPFFTGNNDAGSNDNGIVVEDANTKNPDGTDRIYPTNDPVQPNEVVADTSGAFNNTAESAVASENFSQDAESKNEGKTKTQQQKQESITSPDDAVASGSNTNAGQNLQPGNRIKNRSFFNNTIKSQESVAHKNSKHNNKRNITGVKNQPLQHNDTGVAQRQNNGSIKSANAPQFEDVNKKPGTTPENQNQAVAQTSQNKAADKTNTISPVDTNGVTGEFKAGEAIANAPVANDSTAQPQENALEKLLKEKELGKEKEQEKAVAENSTKWNIKPQMAPVFYNSMSNGSPIDSQLANNNKTYDNNLSYGLGVNYAVNDKISIRSGINTVNLSYSTNGIQFYAALNEGTPNVTGRGRANIVVENQGASTTNGFADEGIEGQRFNGSMVQEMGYIEVPLEMSYKILNKRFGIDVIGGVSTLFLNDNNVSVVSTQGLSSDMGEAQNLNNVHFSTNIGVGFRYRFWKAFEANFEPMFKYQVNTFSSDSGNFKPYFIGLYSGISFSF